jgi:DNA (cytosine-5)-methyltransferase 1
MDYKDLVGELDPDGFVFENVSGLLNMEKGAVFERVKSAFRSVMPQLQGWVLQADHFAIPQRRTRVFLVGHKDEDVKIARPDPLTILDGEKTLFDELRPSVTVEEAIGDLPTLEPKMDGSELPYKHEPNSQFQKLMRGEISPSKYLEAYKQ